MDTTTKQQILDALNARAHVLGNGTYGKWELIDIAQNDDGISLKGKHIRGIQEMDVSCDTDTPLLNEDGSLSEDFFLAVCDTILMNEEWMEEDGI